MPSGIGSADSPARVSTCRAAPARRSTCAVPRLFAALVVAAVAIIGYYASKQVNPVTGEKQAIAMTPEQECRLGLKSAPEMAAQFGGEVRDPAAQRFVQEVGPPASSRVLGLADAVRVPLRAARGSRDASTRSRLPGGRCSIHWICGLVYT
jgi:hypothetical protein